jgi:hypothetical protein
VVARTDIADAEARRLSENGYFEALSAYAHRALPEVAAQGAEQARLCGIPVEHTASNPKSLAARTSPENLAHIFNETTAVTSNALISEVVIIPSNIYSAGRTQQVFNRSRLDVPYNTAFGYFAFGFFQAYGAEHEQSSTFAIFTLDSDAIAPLLPYDTHKMFAGLQKAMSMVNHDMLHHLTAPIIDPVVADKHNQSFSRQLPVYAWADKVRKYGGWGGDSEPYEDLMQIVHENAVLTSDPDGKKTTAIVDDYFKELTRLCAVALADATHQKQKDDVREAVNYCALLMGHALTRVYPLNHPVMTNCLDKMLAVDPVPEKSLEDTLFTRADIGRDPKHRQKALSAYPGNHDKIAAISRDFKSSIDVLQHYGFIQKLPDNKKENQNQADAKEPPQSAVADRYDRAARSWKEAYQTIINFKPYALKLIQLTQVSLIDVQAHVPGSKRMNISRLQNDGARLAFEMIDSMDATIKAIKPPNQS